MKIECPWCHMLAGAYVPKGGDGSALRLRSHKNLWGGKCMGSGMLDPPCDMCPDNPTRTGRMSCATPNPSGTPKAATPTIDFEKKSLHDKWGNETESGVHFPHPTEEEKT